MSHTVDLPGLEGGNPLGFLAALGTLRTLSESGQHGLVTMAWRMASTWTPCLMTEEPCSQDALIGTLWHALRRDDAGAPFALGEDLHVTPDVFRAYALAAVENATAAGRRAVDFVAAFACDGVVHRDFVSDCELRTMSGAGHQHFLGFMRQLVHITTDGHLRSALFAPWTYDDESPSLRWDPEDDRRYALRWREPSGDKIQTVRGANRLAVEGLSLLPSVPTKGRLRTTGFSGTGARGTFWSWPMWLAPLSMDAVRSVVAHPMLLTSPTDAVQLAAIGVAQVFRSQRLTVGKYRNFSPAQPA